MERTLNELKGQLNIKNLRFEYLQSKSAQSEKMFEIGGVSKDQLNQAKLEEHIADIERSDLERSVKSTAASLENQLEGVTTEVKTLLKEKADIERQLNLLACKAERNGVITWIKDGIGSSVHRGEILVRIADLSSYRVEATLSDIHASRLSVGMPARIRYNELSIPGVIETVYPTIENGIAKIVISLDDASNKSLHPNLRVDVYLITSKRDSTLIVKKGPFVAGEGRQDAFVVRGSVAQRVPVQIGVISFDEVEVAEGLSAGDEVIISDMNEYKHLTQVKIH
jgi:HlyD family secretion protein